MNPMNRIYIVLYLNSIQPSRFKHAYDELNLYTKVLLYLYSI